MAAACPPPADRRSAAAQTLGLIYCAAIWGSTFYIVKDALNGVHPVALVGWRFMLAAALMLPLFALRRVNPLAGLSLTIARGGRLAASPGLILGGLLWLLYVAQTVGLGATSAANSAFITGLFIVFVPLLAWLLHRARLGLWQLGALLLAVAGLLLLTGGLAGLNSGDAITLLAALTYSMHVFFAGRYMQGGLDPYALNFQQILLTGALSLLACALFGLPVSVDGARPLLIIIFLALFPTLSAFLIQLVAQQRVDALRVSLVFTLEPVFGAAFAWTLGGEQPSWRKAAGGALIVIAMLASEAPALLAQRRSAGRPD